MDAEVNPNADFAWQRALEVLGLTSASSGVGGSPVRSRVTRLISVARCRRRWAVVKVRSAEMLRSFASCLEALRALLAALKNTSRRVTEECNFDPFISEPDVESSHLSGL